MKKLLSAFLGLMILLSTTGMSAYASIPMAATGIVFEKPSNVTLEIGDSYSNKAVTTPAGFPVTYTSSKISVATVTKGGNVLAMSAGTATITAKSGAVSTSYNVTVTGSGMLKASRVRVNASQSWVRVGRSILLDVTVAPSTYQYDKLNWYTMDYKVAEVDEYGEVKGLAPGIATIVVEVYAEGPRGYTEVGSAEIQIEVRESNVASTIVADKYNPDNPSVSATKTAATEEAAANNGMVATKAVNEAVKKVLNAGTTTNVSFRNYASVSTVSLESAAAEMQLGGGMVLLNFDTYTGKTAEGRLTINPRAYKPVQYSDPLQVGHSIDVTLLTNNDAVAKVRDKFQKFYKNEILVVKAGQQGGYGMSVTGTVKTRDAFAKAKQSNLKLYTYDPDAGKGGVFRLVKNANISIDSNKNLNFTTDTGNYLIISDGALTKK